MYSIYRCKFILLGIRQTGKAVDSESIIYRFDPCIPNWRLKLSSRQDLNDYVN